MQRDDQEAVGPALGRNKSVEDYADEYQQTMDAELPVRSTWGSRPGSTCFGTSPGRRPRRSRGAC